MFRWWKSPIDADGKEVEVLRWGFILTDRTLDMHSWVYFFMEHIIAILLVLCIINPKWLRDDTPKWLFILFVGVLFLDLVHYLLLFRDEGIGWNLAKTLMFGIPLLFGELRKLWTQSNQSENL